MSRSILTIAMCGVIALWTAMFVVPGRPASLNEFGDSFGIVNALFSGLGLVAIVYSLHLQAREIGASAQTTDETRQTVEKQNAELKRSVIAQTAQANALEALVDQYRKHLSELGRQSQIMAERLQHEAKRDAVIQEFQLRTALHDAWERLEALLPDCQTYDDQRDQFEASRYRDAVGVAIAFRENNPASSILGALTPPEQEFLKTHLYRADREQTYFSREAQALAYFGVLAEVEPGQRLRNYMSAKDKYQENA
ncbi:hypothetical protein [Paracoccus sp. (in: a-proteobacteria)]|uniref:hypothetical protein n=1 Tax=Paracoccus sp. TaxID=267 RepID=UPI003A894433